jgi:hypothetical protein
MGSPGIRGFGIVASVPLLAGEYIYELTGLLSVDGNAEHTRLSEIRAADNTVRILFGPLRMLNHDCNPNAEVLSFLPSFHSLLKLLCSMNPSLDANWVS